MYASLFIISFLCSFVASTQQTLNGQTQDSEVTCDGTGVNIQFQCSAIENKLDVVISTIAGLVSESEWQLVFRAAAGVAAPGTTDPLLTDPYNGWIREAPLNHDVPEAREIAGGYQGHYKSPLAVNWGRRNIQEVKVALYDSTGTELLSMIFDGEDSDKTSWFTQDRLLSSPYTDLHTETQNYFSIIGEHTTVDRRWFINRNYGGCPNDNGWLVVLADLTDPPCDWEHDGHSKPEFIYSTKQTYASWNDATELGEADVFAIYVKTKSRYH